MRIVDIKFGEVIQPMMAEIACRCTPRKSRHWDKEESVIAKSLIVIPGTSLPAINLCTPAFYLARSAQPASVFFEHSVIL